MDASDGVIATSGAHSLGDLLAGFVFVAALSALGWLILPALLFAGQLVVLVLVLPVYVALRLVFHQPWIVEATTRSPREMRLGWTVRGLRESGRAVHEIADALRAGEQPTPSAAQPLRRNPLLPPRWMR